VKKYLVISINYVLSRLFFTNISLSLSLSLSRERERERERKRKRKNKKNNQALLSLKASLLLLSRNLRH
jgi:hypothetical protein